MNKPQERQITHVKDVFPNNPGTANSPPVQPKRTNIYKKRLAPTPPSVPTHRVEGNSTACSGSSTFAPRTTVNPLNSKTRDVTQDARATSSKSAPIFPADVGGRSLRSDERNATISTVSHSGSSGYQSDFGVVESVSNDDFDENECTLVFDDEDETPAEGRFTNIYDEYQGEDFSRYLDEDEGVVTVRPERQQASHSRADATVTPAQVAKYRPAAVTSSKVRSRKPGLKERLSRLFTHPSRKQPEKKREPATNIFDFTYTDSKIGSSDVAEPIACNVDGDTPQRKSWWSKNTLSARSMSSNSDIMFSSHSVSRSTPDIYDAGSMATVDDIDNECVNPPSATGTDFASYRKSAMCTSNSNVEKKCKRKTTLLHRLSNSLRRLDKADRAAIESYAEEYERNSANVVVNPLTALPTDENTYL